MYWMTNGVIWVAAYGGYLLFVGATGRNELITAAVLASGAGIWSFALRRRAPQRFAMSAPHALEWAKAIVALGPSLARTFPVFVTAALRGGAPGRLSTVSFERGEESSRGDAARRASALLMASIGPDSFVVRAPRNRDCVLLHAILRGAASRDSRWLNS